MVLYNFKRIQVVPGMKDFLDIVLSRTQRKTPTVVHPQFKISRIRKFYMRKVKYTQSTFHEKLDQILEDFPRLDDIHPFYADLINVLYDKDHYKLALGQLNTARNLIDNVAKDYVRLLKYGDTLYRCKQLKRAALGRMCTVMKKLGPSLAYLEQVRQHLSRLPSIDPSTRTLILTGFPNVGKSSFMNKVTRADVEVHDYPFTTKSLYVGHCDYNYLRWQVIDTPGILDHPLEERNTIEMQAITALAHLRAAVLYFIDVSEKCGYSLEQQVSLFHSIAPLFTGKPVVIVFNKTDLLRPSQLGPEGQRLLASLPASAARVEMSTVSEEGVAEVKKVACDLLLQQRVEAKLRSSKGQDILAHISVAMPEPHRMREAFIPASVLAQRAAAASARAATADEDDEEAEVAAGGAATRKGERKLLKHIEQEMGGPGWFQPDFKAQYDLRVEEWKHDIVPEIIDGHNIADWVDPDIERHLEELDREEDERMARMAAEDAEADETSSLSTETEALVEKIQKKKKIKQLQRRIEEGKNRSTLPRPARARSTTRLADLESKLAEKGFSEEVIAAAAASARGRPRSRSASRRAAGSEEESSSSSGDAMDTGAPRPRGRSRTRASRSESASVSRSRSRVRTPSLAAVARSRSRGPPLTREAQEKKEKTEKLVLRKQRRENIYGRQGESDRRIATEKPRHLFSGKRTQGTHDRR